MHLRRAWCSGFAIALTLLAVGCASSVSGPEPTDIERILAQRQASNAALERRDYGTFQGILDSDYQITLGNGGFEGGAGAAASVREMMQADTYVVYARTPATIDVGSTGERAFESGTWVGTGTTATGDIRIGGRYAAYWRVRDGAWKIHAELFVTLQCAGAGCR